MADEQFSEDALAGLGQMQRREMVGRLDTAMDVVPSQKVYCAGCTQLMHPEAMVSHDGKMYCCLSCKFHNS